MSLIPPLASFVVHRYPQHMSTQGPVIQLLVNGEDFLCRRYLETQLKALVDPSTKDFNFERLTAGTMNAGQIINILNTPPMMAESRVVVVENTENFKKDDLEKLVGYLKKPNPQTHVFFVAEKADKRTSFYKTFEKVGEVIEFAAPYDNKMPRFMTDEAKRLGLSLEDGVVTLLVSLIGCDCGSMVSELEKLALYVHPEKHIRVQNVIDLVSAGVVDNIFEITKLLGLKKLASAHALYERMREQGEPPIKIISLIIGHFRKLLLVQSHLREKPQATQELPQILGVPPFFVKDYIEQARRFSMFDLQKVYASLMRLSEEIRSTGASADAGLEKFFQDVCLSSRP